MYASFDGLPFVVHMILNFVCPQAEDLRVHPLYFMLAAAIAAQFSFCIPMSSFPTVIVKGCGTVTMGDLARAGLGPKIVCLLLLIVSLEGLGSLVYDIHTFPVWAEERRLARYSTLSNGTLPFDTLSISSVIKDELGSPAVFANLSAIFMNSSSSA